MTTIQGNEVRPKRSFIRMDSLDASTLKGLQSKDISQYLKITKLTIQLYLEACLRPDGIFRGVFDDFASFSANYVVNDTLSEDPSMRQLQIARYFSQMREAPPQIFIQDGGYNYEPSGLGGLAEGWNTRENGVQVVRIIDVVKIPITITCVTMSEQHIEDLTAILSFAFGQFQKFTCNYILSPDRSRDGLYWEVRIPLNNQVGAKSHSAMHGDPRVQLWQSSMSMDVEFENSTYIQYRAAPHYSPKNGSMQLNVPDKVPVSKITPFSIKDLPFPVNVYSDDSRVALIHPRQTHWVIQPKRPGKFKLIVLRTGVSTGRPIKEDADRQVIAEKEITVTLR